MKRAAAPVRNVALDFTKGALVLIMVLYHWFNYFVGLQSPIYTYLRFLTPSFIFITGFIVSNIYLSKYDVHDRRLPRRLAERGLKLIAVYAALNFMNRLLAPFAYHIVPTAFGDESFLSQCTTVFLNGFLPPTGRKEAAFPILMPIGVLLLLAALIVVTLRVYKYVCETACVLFFAAAFVLETAGLPSANLGMIAIGLLGMVFGRIPLEKVNNFLRRLLTVITLAIAYGCYVWALSQYGATYPLQIAGVCICLSLLYLLGSLPCERNFIGREVLLLGKYSLFGYIGQIAILQILRRMLPLVIPESARLLVSFILASLLTVVAVECIDRLRRRIVFVDRCYRFVFA